MSQLVNDFEKTNDRELHKTKSNFNVLDSNTLIKNANSKFINRMHSYIPPSPVNKKWLYSRCISVCKIQEKFNELSIDNKRFDN